VKEYVLTDDESRLARDVEEGDICDFSKDRQTRPVIRAEVIRRLLLGLPVKLTREVEDNPRVIKAPGTGIHLVYAQIDDELVLEDGRDRDGSALHALTMERCIIPHTLKLSRSYFRSLSFDGSRLTHLSARDLHLEGSLNLLGVSSSETDGKGTGRDQKGLCWVELHRAYIEGGIEAGNCKFVAPPKRDNIDISSSSRDYAFNLRLAHVRDSVLLEPDVSAIGGVCVQDAKIGGDVRARGGTFVAIEEYGFSGEAAQIGGNLFLSHYVYFVTKKKTKTQIAGGLRLLGIKVGGDLRVKNATVEGDVVMSKASVASTLTIENVTLLRPAHDGRGAFPGLFANLKRFLERSVRRNWPDDPLVELNNARVSVLDDCDGLGFHGRYRLQIDGFEYNRINTSNNVHLVTILLSVWRCLLAFALAAFLITHTAAPLARKVPKFLSSLLLHYQSAPPSYIKGSWIIALVSLAAAITVIYLSFTDFRVFLPQWSTRRRWLNLQYPYLWCAFNERYYDPSPYEQLSRVLRSQGLFEDARRIASRRLTLESRLRTPAIYRPVLWLFGVCFDYGLSSWRAFITFAVCIALGAYATGIADYGFDPGRAQIPYLPQEVSRPVLSMLPQIDRVLVIQANPVNSTVEEAPDRRGHILVFDRVSHNNAFEGELACGKLIEPLLYATDVFIPALDLQQENRCMISTKREALSWRVARVLYSLLGWIVVSLAILTVSGILRRQAEG
jgi:hypothetical protein